MLVQHRKPLLPEKTAWDLSGINAVRKIGDQELSARGLPCAQPLRRYENEGISCIAQDILKPESLSVVWAIAIWPLEDFNEFYARNNSRNLLLNQGSQSKCVYKSNYWLYKSLK